MRMSCCWCCCEWMCIVRMFLCSFGSFKFVPSIQLKHFICNEFSTFFCCALNGIVYNIITYKWIWASAKDARIYCFLEIQHKFRQCAILCVVFLIFFFCVCCILHVEHHFIVVVIYFREENDEHSYATLFIPNAISFLKKKFLTCSRISSNETVLWSENFPDCLIKLIHVDGWMVIFGQKVENERAGKRKQYERELSGGEWEEDRAKVSKHFIFQRKFHSFSEGIFGLFGKSDFIASTCSTNPTAFFSPFFRLFPPLLCLTQLNTPMKWIWVQVKRNPCNSPRLHALHGSFTWMKMHRIRTNCMVSLPLLHLNFAPKIVWNALAGNDDAIELGFDLRSRVVELQTHTHTLPKNKCNFWYRISNDSRKMLFSSSSLFSLLFLYV